MYLRLLLKLQFRHVTLSVMEVEGIFLAWKHGFDSLLVCSDCKRVMELVNSPLAGSSVLPLVRAIHQLCQKHWTTKVIWIPRDDNHCADALAKLVDPSDFSLHVYNSPPLELDLLLCEATSRL
ncbi:hypothetical protein V6N12_030369 [Hibiscus sabdariffa]|uniref:RNase H type-1 domain-containing protein n=1 Tax=Hibiscus sabdariffa TaxID=183260 RepID=A0ABR2C0Q1_9ROSI